MKKERMSIPEFLNGKEKEPFKVKLERHMKKYGIVYKVVGSTIIIFVAGGGFDYAFAASSVIDQGAEKLYMKLIGVGKWIIIFKGGFDTVKHMTNGDFDSAKKGFLSYLVIYLFLLGLPWAMDEVDSVFKDLKA